jgi:ribosomal protein S9
MIDQKMPEAWLTVVTHDGKRMTYKTTSAKEVFEFKIKCTEAGLTYQVNMTEANIHKAVYQFKPNLKKQWKHSQKLHKARMAELRLAKVKRDLQNKGFIMN